MLYTNICITLFTKFYLSKIFHSYVSRIVAYSILKKDEASDIYFTSPITNVQFLRMESSLNTSIHFGITYAYSLYCDKKKQSVKPILHSALQNCLKSIRYIRFL